MLPSMFTLIFEHLYWDVIKNLTELHVETWPHICYLEAFFSAPILVLAHIG